MKKNERSDTLERLSILQILERLNSEKNDFSSDELAEIIDKLSEARRKQEQIEAEEKRKIQEDIERQKAHIREVTCMDLPLDWENIFNSDARTSGVHVESASDALVMSLKTLGKVDIEYIASITGLSYKEIIRTLRGSIYQNPDTWNECFYQGWETSDEYLSGNLMRKWKAANEANAKYDGYFAENLKAIEAVLPPAVATKDIYVTLGSPWVPADIVVNSIIKLENGGSEANISLKNYGVSMHLAPDGKEGYVYTAEEVYEMLPHKLPKTGNRISKFVEGRAKQERSRANASALRTWDDHSRWNALEEDDVLRDVWVKRVEDAAEAIKNREAATGRGLLPMFAKRLLKEIRKPQTDWRTILNDFVQEEIADYSFSPPDRRFDDSPFFLPDFNEKEDTLKDILFMIDTSGSISDDMIAAAYSEVKDAIDQFDGKLKGWLGFSLSKKPSKGWAFSLRYDKIK